jgi:hypothetical protein
MANLYPVWVSSGLAIFINTEGTNGDSLAQHFENEGWCSGTIHFLKLVMNFLVDISHVHILLSFLGSNVGQMSNSKKKSLNLYLSCFAVLSP